MTDVRALQQAFDDAELRVDDERLDELLADDFVSIGDRGFFLDKRQWIGRHAESTYRSIETSEVDVRTYDRAAILRCVQHIVAEWRGEEMVLDVRCSQVWVEQPGGWRLAGIQFSPLG